MNNKVMIGTMDTGYIYTDVTDLMLQSIATWGRSDKNKLYNMLAHDLGFDKQSSDAMDRLDFPKPAPHHLFYGNKAYEAYKKDIKNVVFNDPATIVFWNDGSKTVVKCDEDELYDPEKGLAMAIAKKYFGNIGNYYNNFKKWLPEEEPNGDFTIDAVLQRAIDNLNESASKSSSVLERINKKIRKDY